MGGTKQCAYARGPEKQVPLARFLDNNNFSSGIQTSQVTWVACNDRVSPCPGNDHHRGVYKIAHFGGGAKFSTRTGKVLIQRNNLHFLAA
jgi:hypothetical protein